MPLTKVNSPLPCPHCGQQLQQSTPNNPVLNCHACGRAATVEELGGAYRKQVRPAPSVRPKKEG